MIRSEANILVVRFCFLKRFPLCSVSSSTTISSTHLRLPAITLDHHFFFFHYSRTLHGHLFSSVSCLPLTYVNLPQPNRELVGGGGSVYAVPLPLNRLYGYLIGIDQEEEEEEEYHLCGIPRRCCITSIMLFFVLQN